MCLWPMQQFLEKLYAIHLDNFGFEKGFLMHQTRFLDAPDTKSVQSRSDVWRSESFNGL